MGLLPSKEAAEEWGLRSEGGHQGTWNAGSWAKLIGGGAR